MTMRHWTPYEKTLLQRAGKSDLLKKITDATPVEHLVGYVDFCGWNVQVSPAVLIPRVETEDLVQFCFDEVLQLLAQKQHLSIVEVGTGSGAIGLSLWRMLAVKNLTQRCNLQLIDISEAALAVAQKNLEQVQTEFGAQHSPKLRHMDLLSDWSGEANIDLLIANLPYIPTERLKTLDKSVIEHEPTLALDGGPDGLMLIKKLLQQAETKLSKDGVIWLEVDDEHSLEKFQSCNLPFQYQTLLDCFEKPRFIRVIRYGKEAPNSSVSVR